MTSEGAIPAAIARYSGHLAPRHGGAARTCRGAAICGRQQAKENTLGWFEEGAGGDPVDVTAMLDSKAMDMLTHMVAQGALISLGTTSDRGALGVTVTVDGRWRREYFRDGEQLTLWCEEALAPVLEACEAKSASSARQKRTRGARRP